MTSMKSILLCIADYQPTWTSSPCYTLQNSTPHTFVLSASTPHEFWHEDSSLTV